MKQLSNLAEQIRNKKSTNPNPQRLMQQIQDITQHDIGYKYVIADNANVISRNYLKNINKVSGSILDTYVNQNIPKSDKFFVVKEHYKGHTNQDTVFLGREFRRLTLKDIKIIITIQEVCCALDDK